MSTIKNNKVVKRLFARKTIKSMNEDNETAGYKRDLGLWDLISIGVGGIIGAGIFVLTGRAAADNAGPGIVISYMIAGTISTLASLCYAELASCLPVSGSAYSFAYATLGELMAWIIGWDLMLEYLVGGATVAVGWSGYLGTLQTAINQLSGSTYTFDARFVNAPTIWLEPGNTMPWNNSIVTESGGFFGNLVVGSDGELVNAIINLPAIIIVLSITALLMFGIKESAGVNNIMVCIKLLVVVVLCR
jgi:basic amino acid/polyamine antiporter, APA family